MTLLQTKSTAPTLVKPKAVLFDWDGTLVNTVPIIQAGINHILAKFNHPPAPFGSAHMASVTGSDSTLKMMLGVEQGTKAKAMFEEYMNGVYDQPDSPVGPHLALPGGLELLVFLQAQGIKTCIATNKLLHRMQIECDAVGYGTYLNAFTTLEDVTNRKPHPEMMHVCCAKLGVQPGPDIWMVGDHRVDSESAKQAGLTSISLKNEFDLSDTHPPDTIVPDLAALIPLINGLP